ncbi:YhdP family protein [Curvibacter sp. APW13]|uniref:YhdP family protein n=1 Tax=Curvibacter sp. APW13 TaxID=3077236 RepID=UPI0028DE366D|nr:YhdP family protein [Curvibacter sp. APW13]MDT8990126.1 YhdP family protein [Curvibacter sp. APW13]
MIEPTPTPSPLLRAGAFLARWLLRLLFVAWAGLLLAWGALHAVIVPRIDTWRPWLEARASQALGSPVRIGAIEARSTGVIPALEMQNVQLLDARGGVALSLPRVQVAVSPRSLIGLGFEQLHIENPELEIRRDPQGRLFVAGLALATQGEEDSPWADWVFSQPEVAIVGGKVRWIDELRQTPAITLDEVNLVVRNRLLGHALRLDATPPSSWGARWSVMGRFSQPLLTTHPGRWQAWKGQVYAAIEQVDLAALRPYAQWTGDVMQGQGVLRAWLDVNQSRIDGVTVDVALRQLKARLAPELEPLGFDWVAGRLGLNRRGESVEYFTQGLEFDTADGLHWPGGNVRWTHVAGAKPGQAAKGSVQADRLDLAALAEIAGRLPLEATVRERLRSAAPRGLVERVQAEWQGSWPQVQSFTAQGRVKGLTMAAQAREGGAIPGLVNADLEFDVSPNAGKVHVDMQQGALLTPGVFEESTLVLDRLQGDVQWKLDAEAIQVQVRKLEFANADAAGELDADWHTGSGAQRFPGLLDLRGTLNRAKGESVHRYIPRVVEPLVREYLRTSIQSAEASNVRFKVKGALEHFPFLDPRQGEFRVSADVRQAVYDYAPAMVLPKNTPPWPLLRGLSCALLIDKGQLALKDIRAGIDGVPGLQLSKAEAIITDLYTKPSLQVALDARLPLQEGFAFLKASAISGLTEHFLDGASGSGAVDLRLRLGVPLTGAVHPLVQGSVQLSGNEVALTPSIPRLSRVRGTVAFSDSGFSVTGGQARALGGDARIEGGLSGLGGAPVPKGAPSLLRIAGTASAEGLRQAAELGAVARLAQYAQGSTPYVVQVGLRAGRPELQIQSSLVGLAVNLPAPLTKGAEQAMPLRIDSRAVPGASASSPTLEQWQIELDKLASLTYVLDNGGPQAQVVRGALALGLASDESAPLPAQGVLANLQFGVLDADAWGEVLAASAGSEGGNASARVTQAANAWQGYLPTHLALRARTLSVGGHKFHNLVVGGAREGALWRANLDANEMSGYVEYRQPGPAFAGRLYARLARLAVATSDAQDVENLLDSQPASIPALDVVVEDFDLRGRKLGRLDIDAVNLGATGAREWRLNRFNLAMPEATLTAQGNWAAVAGAPVSSGARSVKERRRTVMNFKLDVADAGELLGRFGMKDVIRKGQGKLEGQIAWAGSPITLDYASMTGGANLNLENGQFLKADPGLAKLLGVLSLQALPRRLTLDFRDVFSEGFSFDFIRGDVTIAQGIARTNNLQMKGVNAAVLMEGQADIERETQSLRVVVVPEINAGSASLLASVINPVVGLTTFLAQWVLRRPLADATTQEFLIEGSWADPKVTRVSSRTAPDADKKPTNPKESVK